MEYSTKALEDTAPNAQEADGTVGGEDGGTANSTQYMGGDSEEALSGTEIVSQPSDGLSSEGTVVLEAKGLVLTRRTLRPGDVVEVGSLLGEVSGRPVFALPDSVPLYRDLAIGVSGEDVRRLQEALAALGYLDVKSSGYFGESTLKALRLMYRKSGYLLSEVAPGIVGLDIDEIVGIPQGLLHTHQSASVGSVVNSDSPIATVLIGDPVIEGRLTMLEAEWIEAGGEVEVGAPGIEPGLGKILDIGEYHGEGDGVLGYDVEISLPEEWNNAYPEGAEFTVTEVGDIAERLAIPLIAVREDDSGTYVLIECAASESRPRRVVVSVIGQSGGFGILRETAGIETDTRFIVGMETCV
jgi:peptidoglycan hydrolase-like protein with peptidoglycan-binding domain